MKIGEAHVSTGKQGSMTSAGRMMMQIVAPSANVERILHGYLQHSACRLLRYCDKSLVLT